MCFFRENLISSILPTTLYLGDNVHRQMDNLWNETASDGRERAGTFVLDIDGNLQLVNIEIGSATGVNTNLDVSEDETFVGTFHTHPRPLLLGQINRGFSNSDILTAINDREKLSMIQTEDDVFALVRTGKTPSSVSKRTFYMEFDELMNQYEQSGFSREEALICTNLDISEKYGLAFYRGKAKNKLEVVYKP